MKHELDLEEAAYIRESEKLFVKRLRPSSKPRSRTKGSPEVSVASGDISCVLVFVFVQG